jgi:hypothetical protein
MKAKDIITFAFAEVVQSKYKIEPVNLVDGLRYLNRMMAKYNAEGIQLGYTSLASPNDVVTVPDTVIMGMVKNLALILWPQYNIGPVNPLIKFSAKRSLNSMRAQAINITEPAQFPATLPVGSGNYNGLYGADFYTNDQGRSEYLGVEDEQ